MTSDQPRGGSALYLAGVCLVASLGGLLFGFDTAVISGTVERVTAQFSLSDLQQGWFTSSALIGCIVGALVSGWLGDRFGRKPNLIVAALLFFVSALLSAIPPNFPALIVARMIGGVGVGMASVLGPMYISELAPPKWRGRLVAFYQLSIVLGILLAYQSNLMIVSYAAAHHGAFGGDGPLHLALISEVWRAMFGAEMAPAALFFLLLFFVPESPRWMIKAGKDAAAGKLLTRISGAAVAQLELDEIRQAVSREKGSIAELFRPGLRLALLVGVMLSVFGQLSGVNIVVYYGPKILAAAGFGEMATLIGQVGFGLINLVFTILALLLIDKLGRRPLLIGGMAVVSVALVVVGSLFLSGTSAPGVSEFRNVTVEGKAIQFDRARIEPYADQGTAGTLSLLDEENGLRLEAIRWTRIDLPIKVTPDTVLEFDFRSTERGEIHAVGFDEDNNLDKGRLFQLYGTQHTPDFHVDDFLDYEDSAGQWKHYVIPVGEYYTGEMKYLALVNGAFSRTTGIWVGVMICVYMAAIAFSICAVIWVLTPEIFPNRVRGRAASICTFANWSTNAMSAFAFPWYVATFGMHTGFFTSAAICLVATLFFFRYVPETKGKSLEEIEKSWSR